MRKYLAFFRLRFSMGLQYRAAALAGVVTQFFWGAMEVLVFHAFYEAEPEAFPMTLAATSSYIWLQQAFLAFFAAWMMEDEIFDGIKNGNVVYELCRPLHIYYMWFSRSVANRMSRAVLRCFPILIIASFLPQPYGLSGPAGGLHFLLFLVTMVLGLLTTVAFCMLVYVLSFFTVSPEGLRLLFVSMVEFLTGGIVPLPFLPEKVRFFLELLPFAAMQNVPLRIYSGSMSGNEMAKVIALQVFWLMVLGVGGKKLCDIAEKRVTLQGG